jgi:CRISPR-associated exonuclease Cas4
MMVWIAVFFLLCAVFLMLFSQRKQRQSGLPKGRVIYQDTGEQITPNRPLYDSRLGLTGMPDYLLRQGNLLIPVEVKSSISREAPYDSHVQQLMAYCLLVQSNYHRRPEYGILHYPQRTIAIDFSQEREDDLVALIQDMKARLRSGDLTRSHQSLRRCQACGYRRLCDQRL